MAPGASWTELGHPETRKNMEPPIPWHDLLALLCSDFLADSPFAVQAEIDLSRKKQLLDLVIVRTSDAPFSGRLPDGLDDLGRHNLITFKSFQETLDPGALRNCWLTLSITGNKSARRSKTSCPNRNSGCTPSAPVTHGNWRRWRRWCSASRGCTTAAGRLISYGCWCCTNCRWWNIILYCCSAPCRSRCVTPPSITGCIKEAGSRITCHETGEGPCPFSWFVGPGVPL